MKIFCIGRNYSEHAKELNNAIPKSPVVFMKPPTALLKNNRPFFYPDFSENIHHEVEIVLKINKNGKHIQEKFAHKYYDELSLGIDFTARDLQSQLKEKSHPWEIAKGFDGSAVVGNFVSKDKYQDINNINFSLKKNDTTTQEGNTKDMIFSFDHIISHLSKYFMFQKGDLIYTGTPAGVGQVVIDDFLEGYIEDEKIFDCRVK